MFLMSVCRQINPETLKTADLGVRKLAKKGSKSQLSGQLLHNNASDYTKGYRVEVLILDTKKPTLRSALKWYQWPDSNWHAY